MAGHIPLNDLIEALAGAVIEAQDNIEQHQISNLLGYFDSQKRPKSLVVRLRQPTPRLRKGLRIITVPRCCRSFPPIC